MAAYPHVADWVRDFEQRYGTRPIYYGPLDRGAMKTRPLNSDLRDKGTYLRSYLRTSGR